MFICIFTFASKGSTRDTQFTDWILGEELRNEYDFIQTEMIHIRLLFLKYLFHIPPRSTNIHVYYTLVCWLVTKILNIYPILKIL